MKIGNAKWAEILVNSVSGDKEVNPEIFQRTMTLNDDVISVHFCATQWKWLRVGIQSFYDNMQLCLQTIQTFENYK